jgi:hypothetical protein
MVERFWPFYLATLPGIALGLFALGHFDACSAELVPGVWIIRYSIARPAIILPLGLQRTIQPPAGLLNGFFTGLTGSQVMPLLPYRLDRAQLRAGDQHSGDTCLSMHSDRTSECGID